MFILCLFAIQDDVINVCIFVRKSNPNDEPQAIDKENSLRKLQNKIIYNTINQLFNKCSFFSFFLSPFFLIFRHQFFVWNFRSKFQRIGTTCIWCLLYVYNTVCRLYNHRSLFSIQIDERVSNGTKNIAPKCKQRQSSSKILDIPHIEHIHKFSV